MSVIRKPQARPATIADVAGLAGVSVATVSRALANPAIVAPESRQRVLDAVRQTGYTPNAAARNLRVRRAMMVLVVVPDLANPFFAEVLRGIDAALAREGYGLIIANLDNSIEKEARYVDLAAAGQVDGVLLLCGHIPAGGGRSMATGGIPMVAACEPIAGAGFAQVEINNRAAAAEAVRHLLGLGHRRIAYLSGPATNILDHERFAGYCDALGEAGIAPAPEFHLPGDFTFRTGVAAAHTVLAMARTTRPTALFAANDEMAIGFLKTVQAAGLRVPGDLSIVGFDAIDYAEYCQPTLTTVSQPRHDIGLRAAELLIAAMAGRDGRSDAPTHHTLTATLLLRDSTGPVAAG